MLMILVAIQILLLVWKAVFPTDLTWIQAIAPFHLMGWVVYFYHIFYTVKGFLS